MNCLFADAQSKFFTIHMKQTRNFTQIHPTSLLLETYFKNVHTVSYDYEQGDYSLVFSMVKKTNSESLRKFTDWYQLQRKQNYKWLKQENKSMHTDCIKRFLLLTTYYANKLKCNSSSIAKVAAPSHSITLMLQSDLFCVLPYSNECHGILGPSLRQTRYFPSHSQCNVVAGDSFLNYSIQNALPKEDTTTQSQLPFSPQKNKKHYTKIQNRIILHPQQHKFKSFFLLPPHPRARIVTVNILVVILILIPAHHDSSLAIK